MFRSAALESWDYTIFKSILNQCDFNLTWFSLLLPLRLMPHFVLLEWLDFTYVRSQFDCKALFTRSNFVIDEQLAKRSCRIRKKLIFDKLHSSNVFWPCKLGFRQICQKFLIYTIKMHLIHEICQRKFGSVKGAYNSYVSGFLKLLHEFWFIKKYHSCTFDDF